VTLRRFLLAASSLIALAGLASAAAPPAAAPRPAAPARLPITNLTPAKLVPDQCVLRYRVGTGSQKCQAYVDQALGYFYSYVWMEAARSFETALSYDKDCAFAWWGLSRAQERWGRGDATKSLLKAWELREHGGKREQYLFKAAMEEKGQLPGVGNAEQRLAKAVATLDEMLALYDDDEEAWYFRAQLTGGKGLFGGKASSVPFYKALLKVNPLHPGANHELVHFYENFQRPALGWKYAEGYLESSPGIPHAFHMQAHLATRLGKWKLTSDRSAKAIEMERAYHKREGVKPSEDHQYNHQLETLLISLTHDGRFREAREVVRECKANNHYPREAFFRLHLAERDYKAALEVADEIRTGRTRGKGGPARRGDKTLASYLTALVYLEQGEAKRALAEIEVLQNAWRVNKNDKRNELRLYKAQGLYLCLTGDGAAGLKLLQKTVEKTKDNYAHHAWGNGAYYMEPWGVGALWAGKLDVAEEAFHEALAHDPGCVRAALGMQVVCERQGRSEEAERYAALARKCWSKADSTRLDAELTALRDRRPSDASKGEKR
jgi:hypothetical protein